MTTTLDIAALVNALVWPIVLVVALLLLRDRFMEALGNLAPRLKSVSIGGFSLELAEAQPLSIAPGGGGVDLRHAGQSGDINDSTLRSFYAQIEDPARLDYAVIDVGEGREWLTSRLFILSEILARMRGLKVLVFVETAGHVRRRLVGVSACHRVRWRLAMRFRWLEAARAEAESGIWEAPDPMPFAPRVANDEG